MRLAAWGRRLHLGRWRRAGTVHRRRDTRSTRWSAQRELRHATTEAQRLHALGIATPMVGIPMYAGRI